MEVPHLLHCPQLGLVLCREGQGCLEQGCQPAALLLALAAGHIDVPDTQSTRRAYSSGFRHYIWRMPNSFEHGWPQQSPSSVSRCRMPSLLLRVVEQGLLDGPPVSPNVRRAEGGAAVGTHGRPGQPRRQGTQLPPCAVYDSQFKGCFQ